MRRNDIIQLVVIIAGIVAAYNGLVYIPEVLVGIFYWFDGGLRGTATFTTMSIYLVVFILYLALGAILISRSQQITRYIIKHSGVDSALHLEQSKKDLLYILFLGIGCFTIISKFPPLLKNIFIAFSEKVGRRDLDSALHSPYSKSADFTLPIIHLVLALLLVLFANQLAIYFASKISNEEDLDKIGDEPV